MAQVNQVDTVALAIATAQSNISTKTQPAGFVLVGTPPNQAQRDEQSNTANLRNELPTQ